MNVWKCLYVLPWSRLEGEPFVAEEEQVLEAVDQQPEQFEQGKYNMNNPITFNHGICI